MKQLLCLLLAICLPLCALAESYDLQSRRRCQALTFTATPPDPLREALAASAFAGDEVLQGVMLTTMTTTPPGVEQRIALLALRRGEKTLLLWCSKTDGDWTLEVIADSFLPAGADFAIDAVPYCSAQAWVMGEEYRTPMSVMPVIRCCGGEFLIAGRTAAYRRENADGTRIVISSGGTEGLLCIDTCTDGAHTEEYLPGYGTLRLSELRADTFPATREEAAAWCAARPWPEGVTAISAGANLRAERNSKSRLIGWCNRGTLLDILDVSADGLWYYVRAGNTAGWAYHLYVHRAGEYFSAICAQEGLPVARANGNIALRTEPGSRDSAALPAGTLMHVLGKIDGWLHVCVPREAGFHPDPQGTYGYIRERDVTQAETLLQFQYPQ